MKCVMEGKYNADADIILTGGKDFLSIDLDHPKCMSVAQFLEYEQIDF